MKTYLLLLSVCILAACSAKSDSNEIEKKKDLKIETAVPVEVMKAHQDDLPLYVQTYGYAQPLREAPAVLKKGGYLTKAPKEGAAVYKGDTVVVIENSEEKTQLHKARSLLVDKMADFAMEVDNDEAAIAAAKKIMHDNNTAIPDIEEVLGGGSREEVIYAKSGLADAWYAFSQARIAYRNTFFIAPFAGRVADVQFRKGQWLASGSAACKVIDISAMRITAELLEEESASVSQNAGAQIIFSALSEKQYQGKVIEINPLIDPEKRTMRVTLKVDNPGEHIKAGMYSEVKIETDILPQRLIVPREALLVRDNREMVFIVRDSTAQWCYVESGASNGEYVEILSSEFGLKPGEDVVVEGHFSLAHNTKVKPVEKEE